MNIAGTGWTQQDVRTLMNEARRILMQQAGVLLLFENMTTTTDPGLAALDASVLCQLVNEPYGAALRATW